MLCPKVCHNSPPIDLPTHLYIIAIFPVELVLDEFIKKANPSAKDGAMLLTQFAHLCYWTREEAMRRILQTIWINHSRPSRKTIYDSCKRFQIDSFRHRLGHDHVIKEIVSTVHILLPRQTIFLQDVLLQTSLAQNTINRNHAITHFYLNLLTPLQKLQIVVLVIDYLVAHTWSWVYIESISRALVQHGFEVHLNVDLRSMHVRSALPQALSFSLTALTFCKFGGGWEGTGTVVRILKAVEAALRILNIHWNGRESKSCFLVLTFLSVRLIPFTRGLDHHQSLYSHVTQ
jgi:hypothetical protein